MNKSLDIGRVFQDTFDVLGRKLVDLVVLGLIFVAVPTLLLSLISAPMIEPTVGAGGMFAINFSFGLFIIGILSGLLPFLLQAAVVHVTVQTMSQRESDVPGAIGVAFRVLLPLFIVSILMSIGLAIGFMLLIIPGLILLTVWVVTVPALVAERAGIFGSFGRSAELTRGSRWMIFGLMVIAWLVLIVFGLVFSMLTFGTFHAGMMNNSVAEFSLISAVLGSIVDTVAAIIAAVGVSALYVQLREMKDGTNLDTIGDVFR